MLFRSLEHTAVEQEAHATRSTLAWPKEVDAREPPGIDLDPALLASLAPAGLPRCLSVGFHLPTRDRPTRFVSRLQYEQPAGRVENQGAGRCRDPRDLVLRLFHQANATAARQPGGQLDPMGTLAMVHRYRLDDPIPVRADEDPPEDRNDADGHTNVEPSEGGQL